MRGVVGFEDAVGEREAWVCQLRGETERGIERLAPDQTLEDEGCGQDRPCFDAMIPWGQLRLFYALDLLSARDFGPGIVLVCSILDRSWRDGVERAGAVL